MASEANTRTFNISVPHPTLKIVLTRPRESDGASVIAALNDPRVYLNLNTPPFPYTEKDWADRYAKVSRVSDDNLADLQAIHEQQRILGTTQDWQKRKWLGQRQWTSTIRELANGGAEPMDGKSLGEIGVQRQSFIHVVDAEERQKMIGKNDKLEPGDPRIVWMVGCKS